MSPTLLYVLEKLYVLFFFISIAFILLLLNKIFLKDIESKEHYFKIRIPWIGGKEK